MRVFPVRHEALRIVDRPHGRLRIKREATEPVECVIRRLRGTLDAFETMHAQRNDVRRQRSTPKISLANGGHTLLHTRKRNIGGHSRGLREVLVVEAPLNSSDGRVTRFREWTILL